MSSPPSSRKSRSKPIPRKQDLEVEPVVALMKKSPMGANPEITPIHSGLPTQIVANGEAFKAIILGNKDVGKTRMTYLYVNGDQPPAYETVGCEYYSKTIIFGTTDSVSRHPVTKSMRVNFYDTAGQEKYNSLTVSHYRKALGAIVVYSITDRASFVAAENWIEKVKDNAGPNCSTILVANKADVPAN